MRMTNFEAPDQLPEARRADWVAADFAEVAFALAFFVVVVVVVVSAEPSGLVVDAGAVVVVVGFVELPVEFWASACAWSNAAYIAWMFDW